MPAVSETDDPTKRDPQAEVMAFLRNAESYPHLVNGPQHIETHISHVFLTGSHAYKLKKAVQFEFLDFSTLEKRKYFCEEEIRLNSRFSPEIYEAVVPIARANGTLHFGDGGEVVDYVVRMKQFDTELVFDSLAKKGTLKETLLEEVTEAIAKFHLTAEPRPEYWGLEAVRSAMQQNFVVCRRFIPSILEKSSFERLEQQMEALFLLRSDLIQKRQKTHVRAVHGDLHLRNMCVYEGRARLFDGLEFNPALASCDVWADLAFFIMDLLHRDRQSDAALVWDRYLRETDDFEGIELLDLYISYRAMVRSKVACLALENESGANQEQLGNEARDYLDLAAYTLRSSRGKIIAIGGLSGSGKSTLSSAIARQLHAVHVRSDAVRKHIAGVPLTKTAPPEVYSEEMNEKTYRGLFERARCVLRSGRTAILDAVFHSPVRRSEVEELATMEGVPFAGVWCSVPTKIAGERLRTRLEDISDADEGILSKQQQYNLGHIAWPEIDTSRQLRETLGLVLNQIECDISRQLIKRK